jgi:signal transduction histidine kinase
MSVGSRLDGSPSAGVSDVNLLELIDELKQETEQVHENPSLVFVWRVEPELPQVYTDRAKLKIILKNLLSNAIKFTAQGTITVEVHPRDSGVEWSVTDTGIGIAPDVLPVIFDLFQQGDSSTTRHYGGVGLGLYIVRRMVELLGGTVAVESTLGRGSTFRVWVPVSEAPPLPQA